MNAPTTLSLIPVEQIPAAARSLEDGYQAFALHGRETIHDALEQARPHRPWFVLADNQVAGFIALRPSDRDASLWTTTTFIDPHWRQVGISRALKESALAASRHTGSPFVVYVRADNSASLLSMRRIFPDAEEHCAGESICFAFGCTPTPTVPKHLTGIYDAFVTRFTDTSIESPPFGIASLLSNVNARGIDFRKR